MTGTAFLLYAEFMRIVIVGNRKIMMDLLKLKFFFK